MANAAVVSYRTVPTMKDAHKYLFNEGYSCIGTSWLRGQRDYARIETQPSGRVLVTEGVA
ncbi:MAG: hypothetical protein ACRC8Q_07425 [Aeromonas sp.]